jgi:hypothetical protein
VIEIILSAGTPRHTVDESREGGPRTLRFLLSVLGDVKYACVVWMLIQEIAVSGGHGSFC